MRQGDIKMYTWQKAILGFIFFSNIAALDMMVLEHQQNQRDIALKKEKKEDKQKFARQYGDSLTSQAVFILPPPGPDDDTWKKVSYQICDELKKSGIKAFIVGDTAGTDLEGIERNVKNIQQEYNFSSITVLSLTHGNICGLDTKPYTSTTEIKAKEAWEKYPDKTFHVTQISKKGPAPSTRNLIYGMNKAAQVKKMDWFSLTCYAGAMKQEDVNLLPQRSVFVGMSGGGQVNYFNAHFRMLSALQNNKMQFDEGVDALDFMVEALKGNWRVYNADVVIGVSGGDEMAVIPSENRFNDFSSDAIASNNQQMEKAKKVKVKKSPRPH